MRLIVLNLVVLLVGGELLAAAVGWMRLGETWGTIADAKAQFLRRVPRPRGQTPTPGAAVRAADNRPRALHPYFGFTYVPDDAQWSTNNLGFLSDVDYPYRGPTDELTVGVFGGSLALDLRLPAPRRVLEEGLLPLAEESGHSRVRVLMFAQGGWKHPQSAIASLYFMDDLDLMIHVDGFNEIALLPLADGPGPAWDLPNQQIYTALSERGARVEDVVIQREIASVRRRQIALTERAAAGPLGWSMAVHLLWHGYVGRTQGEVSALTAELSSQVLPSDPSQGLVGAAPAVRNAHPLEERRSRYFDRYAGWIEMVHREASRRDKALFHFIQPNQYRDGSKRFSEHEQATVLTRMEFLGPRVNTFYPRLTRLTEALNARGVASHDLSMIFAGVDETLYQDDCCHLNERGMELLAQAVLERILEDR